MDFVGIFLSAMLVAATPILLAALGELVTEKAGVINLGIEGLMLIGAVAGFATASTTGISLLGVFTAAIASVMAAGIFIFLTQFLKTNQIATGLAMTIFGIGLSSLLGKSYVGVTIEKIPSIPIPLLHKIPLLGDFLFNHDILVYFSIIAVFLVHFFLSKTRAGMILKAVGENHTTACCNMGYSVKMKNASLPLDRCYCCLYVKTPSRLIPVVLAVAKPATAPISISPSMPKLITPAFSVTNSPKAAKRIGVAATSIADKKIPTKSIIF